MHFNIELIRKISFNMNLKLQISRIIRVAINREKVALIPGDLDLCAKFFRQLIILQLILCKYQN